MFDVPPLLPGFDVNLSKVTVQVGFALLIPADPNRIIIYFQNQGTSALQMTPDTPSVDVNHWAFQTPGGGNIRFTWELDGPISTLGWWLSMQTSPAVISWTAVRWFPERLGVM